MALPAPDEDDTYARIEQGSLRVLAAILHSQLEAVVSRDNEYVALTCKLVRDGCRIAEEEVEKNEHLEPRATASHLATATRGYTVSRQTRPTVPIAVSRSRK